MNKSELDNKNVSLRDDEDYPLQILKEELEDYLPFLSVDYVVCDVCNKKVRTRDFPFHVEQVHYDPPERTWRFGFDQRRKRRVKVYE